MKKNKSPVGIMGIISMASIPLVMTLGNSMLIPVLPLIQKKLNISSLQSSMLITCYSIASILLIPLAGYLSDRWGRKQVIIPSLFLVLVGGLVSGFASWKMKDPYGVIVSGRILQGVGASGAFPIVLPLVGDLFKSDEQASSCLGIIETANTFGKVLSPVLGALLGAAIWFLPFFMIGALSLASIVLVFFFVKAPPRKKGDTVPFKKFLQKTKKIFQKEGRWLYTLFLVGGFAMFILFALQVYLSTDLEEQFHMKGVKKGLILAIPLLFLCISSLVSSKAVKGSKTLMKNVIILGLAMQVFSLLFFKRYDSIFLIVLLFTVNGIAIGIILPALDALITENIEKSQRGLITSFYSSARFFGVAAGPLAMSALYDKPLFIPVLFANAFTVLLIILVIKKLKVDGTEEPSD